ncbi:ferrochelatase [Lactococcus hodotermopsidis]|uniref:Ferrochelatase n=1 Tax=Pseudolactococcus hodotermopsidis TaxID=2709157 RepID=A0A6A0BFR2_9LACT|nr:TMEM175 family protein [Lactococcus hodotermopsidis]GFH42667.1 ferrochelatase [Lactococcus hodotermopsidis]
MNKNRTEAFTDAIIAIVMTILVLEFPSIHGEQFADLLALKDVFLAYVVSFVFLIIYWSNHHHIFQLIDLVNGKTLWLNNVFIFLLTLVPFTTNWLGDHIWARDPELLYATLFLVVNVVWVLLIKNLVKANSHNPHVATILGDYKKSYQTLGLNVLALIIAIVLPIGGLVVNVMSFLLWVVPDKRIEKIKRQSK